MPGRRSGHPAGEGFLQHQPRIACPGPLRWHFKSFLSWSNSKLTAIKKKIINLFCFLYVHLGKSIQPAGPMENFEQRFLQLGQLPPQLLGCEIQWKQVGLSFRAGVRAAEPLLLAATCLWTCWAVTQKCFLNLFVVSWSKMSVRSSHLWAWHNPWWCLKMQEKPLADGETKCRFSKTLVNFYMLDTCSVKGEIICD